MEFFGGILVVYSVGFDFFVAESISQFEAAWVFWDNEIAIGGRVHVGRFRKDKAEMAMVALNRWDTHCIAVELLVKSEEC